MTSVENIYEYFLSQIDDEMFALLRPELARKLLHIYLEQATALFTSCKKNLDINDYSCDTYTLGFGEDIFEIPNNIIKNIEIIGNESNIEYKKGTDWNIITKEKDDVIQSYIEFTSPLIEDISIHNYEDGFFENELTIKEKMILSRGMILAWLQPKVNREENLKQDITDGDYKKLSGANMLDKLLKLRKESEDKFRELIVLYTYDSDFKGFN